MSGPPCQVRSVRSVVSGPQCQVRRVRATVRVRSVRSAVSGPPWRSLVERVVTSMRRRRTCWGDQVAMRHSAGAVALPSDPVTQRPSDPATQWPSGPGVGRFPPSYGWQPSRESSSSRHAFQISSACIETDIHGPPLRTQRAPGSASVPMGQVLGATTSRHRRC